MSSKVSHKRYKKLFEKKSKKLISVPQNAPLVMTDIVELHSSIPHQDKL